MSIGKRRKDRKEEEKKRERMHTIEQLQREIPRSEVLKPKDTTNVPELYPDTANSSPEKETRHN